MSARPVAWQPVHQVKAKGWPVVAQVPASSQGISTPSPPSPLPPSAPSSPPSPSAPPAVSSTGMR